MTRIVRHIMPLGPRVLVRVLPDDDRTESGLYLPAGRARERTQEALRLLETKEVLATVDEIREDEMS